jgi:hypothetical protein
MLYERLSAAKLSENTTMLGERRERACKPHITTAGSAH